MQFLFVFITLCMSIALNILSFRFHIKKEEQTTGKVFALVHYCILEMIVCFVYPSTFVALTMVIGGLLTMEDMAHMEVAIWKLVLLICIAMLACVSHFSWGNVIAAVLFIIGLIILYFIYDGMLGEADIIYMGCIPLIIGAIPSVYAVCVGCILSILSVIPLFKQKEKVPLPFLPGLCAGFGYAVLLTPIIPK